MVDRCDIYEILRELEALFPSAQEVGINTEIVDCAKFPEEKEETAKLLIEKLKQEQDILKKESSSKINDFKLKIIAEAIDLGKSYLR